MSAVQSVDDLAQMEQIAEPGEIMGAIIGIVQRRSRGRLRVPVGPLRWNQRATAIWQSHENEKDAAPPYTADRRQCPAFKGMMLAGNDHRVGNIAVMGSLWPPPSIRFITGCFCNVSGGGCGIGGLSIFSGVFSKQAT